MSFAGDDSIMCIALKRSCGGSEGSSCIVESVSWKDITLRFDAERPGIDIRATIMQL